MPGTWSYDPTDLATSAKDSVRFLIQDTQTTRQLMYDEEITWVITQEANVYMAAAMCCDILVARNSGIKTKKISEFSITYDVNFYRGLAMKLRARGMTYQTPYAGGISIADKMALEADSDWVAPSFVRNQDDNPGAPQPGFPAINGLTSI